MPPQPQRHRARTTSPKSLHGPDAPNLRQVDDAHLTQIADLPIPDRRERTCPHAVKRARHNNYRIKKPDEPASTRHLSPASVRIHALKPRAA